MQQIVLMFHVIIAIALVVLVLMQQGKGADMGASFGGGASQTLFGSQGSASFMMKLTGVVGLLFFGTSLLLGYLGAHQTKVDPLQGLSKLEQQQSLVKQAPAPQTSAPATPVAGVPLTPVSSDELAQQLAKKPAKSQ